MNLKNLRIGNKLYWEDKAVEVVEIHKDCFYIEHCKYGTLKSTVIDVRPIKITEEILLNCGFEKKDHLFRLHLVNSIYIEFNSECNLWFFDIYMNTSRIELQYLHELQNIYSSIAFKELEINL